MIMPVPAPTALLNPNLVLMLTTCGATIAAGSSLGAGRSLNPFRAGAADAGAVGSPKASPNPTTASTLTNHDHQGERWCHLLIAFPPASGWGISITVNHAAHQPNVPLSRWLLS
ncbi:Uncharacterised protein [Mycobacterium tuberculosis]|nr:Uncharacterised protein [Mycobacterium tuberculosis]